MSLSLKILKFVGLTLFLMLLNLAFTKSSSWFNVKPFTDEAQTALFKDPVRTAL